MTKLEQWLRVKEIVGAALECEPGTMDALLDRACFHDPQLRSEVDSLIAAHGQADRFSSPGWDEVYLDAENPPQTIGPYTLERKLGAGGMGQVWLAKQTKPLRRQVALKLIRAGLYDPQVAHRFLAERQSLALMNHPAIAKIFDAGTTPAGQPYLVMEYVEGCPITEYCDRHRLAIAERLKLFQVVCEGVQHAHQKAIIHRDLKPSNILVTEVDGKPVPRIIDFGVAKALTQGLGGETMLTRAGSVIGTLGYMSPEQAASEGNDIDTRSDVYSLGVVLYELLVGTLPLDPGHLTYYEALRQLREIETIRPSTRVRSLGNGAPHAQNRNTDVPALVRQLRGDADSITLKALEKDRARRYSSPSALVADIDHYLCNEPVSAHSAGRLYLATKYVRRHRAGVAIAASVLFLLVGFSIAQAVQLRNVRRQRDRADRITGFMTDMFKVADPSESRGNTITAREILDKSADQVEHGLGSDPSVQSQLMGVMAQTYLGLGLYERARTLTERTLDIQRQSLGPRDRNTLASMRLLGSILFDQGRDVDAEALLRRTIDQQSRTLGPEDPATLDTQDALATLLNHEAHYAEAEKLERSVVATNVRRFGHESLPVFRSMNTLTSALRGENRFDEAEKLFRPLLESERRKLGLDHPYVLVTMHNLANTLSAEGRYDEAEALYRETLAIERRVLGPEHPLTADTLTTLANTVVFSPRRKAEAEALYRQALAIEIRASGPGSSYTTRAQEGLANVLDGEHSYGEAERIFRQLIATRLRVLGPHNTDVLLSQYNLASVMFHEGRLAESEELLRNTLAQQTHVLDANDLDTLGSKSLLARVLLKENRPQQAEELAKQAFDTQLRILGPQHPDTKESLFALTEGLTRLDRYSEAQLLYQKIIKQVEGLPNGDVSGAWYNFACMAAVAGHGNDAFAYLNHAIETGYADVNSLRTDEDLKTLRKDPKFSQMLVAAEHEGRDAPATPLH